jgi:hypothetical protein
LPSASLREMAQFGVVKATTDEGVDRSVDRLEEAFLGNAPDGLRLAYLRPRVGRATCVRLSSTYWVRVTSRSSAMSISAIAEPTCPCRWAFVPSWTLKPPR